MLSPYRLLTGFIAGFFATLVFHQFMVAVLWGAGVAPFAPFPVHATAPFGVPSILSLAFWGGVWGIVYALVDRHFARGIGYWGSAFVFGAILPSLVALLVVAPLKGASPTADGLPVSLLLVAVLVNGAWGVGTGVFLRLQRRILRSGSNW
ncbi:MAG: hypothetical protein WD382_11720 [Halofilum sp. (in: g-proteobacteria)]